MTQPALNQIDKRRRRRVIRAHAIDVSDYQARFACDTCGHEMDWLRFGTIRQRLQAVKHGLPCRVCTVARLSSDT